MKRSRKWVNYRSHPYRRRQDHRAYESRRERRERRHSYLDAEAERPGRERIGSDNDARVSGASNGERHERITFDAVGDNFDNMSIN